MPVMLSCITDDKTPICSWMLLNKGRIVLPKWIAVATRAASGIITSPAKSAFSNNIATQTPTSQNDCCDQIEQPDAREALSLGYVADGSTHQVARLRQSTKAKGRCCRLK